MTQKDMFKGSPEPSSHTPCIECNSQFDDNPGKAICKTCEDWLVAGSHTPADAALTPSNAACADCKTSASPDDIGTTCRDCGRGIIEATPDARIGEHGRMTTCCGACSTIDQDTGELYCKACFKVVAEGEGDGGGRVTIEIGDPANHVPLDAQDVLLEAEAYRGHDYGDDDEKPATPQVDALSGMTPLGMRHKSRGTLADSQDAREFYIADEFNTKQWDANCHTCEAPCQYSDTDQRCDNCKAIPEVTLKRVEYSQMNSTDSHCFGAVVLLDGKAFCEARDDGNGGEQQYSAIQPKGGMENWGDARRAIDARISEIDAALLIRDGSETTERGDGSSFTLANNCFDYIICNLMNEWLAAKHLRRLLKKRVVYFTDGTIMETQCAKNKAQLAQWIAASKPDEGIILNSLTFTEALKLFREAT